jgi:hypothetical protein
MLRPLTTGEILDAGVKLYLRHWRVLMICVVGIVLPVRVVNVLLVASANPAALHGTTGLQSASNSGTGYVVAEIVILVLAVLTSLLATAACFKAIADAWLGTAPAAGRSLRYALGRLVALLVSFLVYFLVGALSLVLLLPGAALGSGWYVFAGLVLLAFWVWLAIAGSLLVPVVLFERMVAVKALLRSIRLVEGRWWATFGTLLVAYLLALVFTLLVQGVVQVVPSALSDSDVAAAIGEVVGSTLAAMVTTPYIAAIVTLLYFDRRVRKEGFDLQLLAEGLGAERDPDGAVPAPLAEPEPTDAGSEWLPPQPRQ